MNVNIGIQLIFKKMYLKTMILKYFVMILTSLKIIHVGTIIVKIKASIKLGFLLSLPTFLLDKISQWGFDNSEYIIIVLCAIAIDHVLGTIKHLRMKDFSVKKNLVGLMTKIGLIVACGFLFEGLNIIITHDTIVKDYLIIVTRLIVFLYPGGSAFANSTVLSNGKFPPQSWLDKLNSFQTNLNPKEFGNQENENQENINFNEEQQNEEP